jgi:hypothetical protein
MVLNYASYFSVAQQELKSLVDFLLSYPSRWRYDILRVLDYFQYAGIDYDDRMDDAIDLLLIKRRKDGKWPLQMKHAGKTHFDIEKCGEASRWNTLRALRVLKHFGIKI